MSKPKKYDNATNISGSNIDHFRTINSMYANNCIVAVMDNGQEFKLDIAWLKEIVGEFTFNVEKKRVHSYLIEPENIIHE